MDYSATTAYTTEMFQDCFVNPPHVEFVLNLLKEIDNLLSRFTVVYETQPSPRAHC